MEAAWRPFAEGCSKNEGGGKANDYTKARTLMGSIVLGRRTLGVEGKRKEGRGKEDSVAEKKNSSNTLQEKGRKNGPKGKKRGKKKNSRVSLNHHLCPRRGRSGTTLDPGCRGKEKKKKKQNCSEGKKKLVGNHHTTDGNRGGGRTA